MANERVLELNERTVWTKKGSTVQAFPVTGALPAAAVVYARRAVMVLGTNSADISIDLGYQIASEDLEDSWGTATAIATDWETSSGRTTTATWTDISAALTKRLVRFVWMVKNTAGSGLEVAVVSGRLELRSL